MPLDMEELPSIYWLPKLHKNPYGNRFIAASNKCTTKPLSRLLTSCLSTVLVHYSIVVVYLGTLVLTAVG